MAPTALITGITGQDGSYLAELLLDKGYDVHGMVRRASTEKFDRIEHIRDRITLHQGDLLDQRSLVDALRASEPDEIYNLAAMSLRRRVVDPAHADRRVHRRGRHADARGDARGLPRGALLPGLLELGDVRQGARGPADRDDALLPALALRRGQGLRALHHGQLPRVLRPARDHRGSSSTTSRRAAASSSSPARSPGTRPPSSTACSTSCALGNLDAERDWGYAKDYVEAMWLMLQQDEPEDYVIATGQRRTRCASAVEVAFDEAGLGDCEQYVEIDPAFVRPAEVDHLIGDSAQGRARPRLEAADELRGAHPPDDARATSSCCAPSADARWPSRCSTPRRRSRPLRGELRRRDRPRARLRALHPRPGGRGLRARVRRLLRRRARASASPTAPTRSRSRCARWASARATRSSSRRSPSTRAPRRSRRPARRPVFCDVDPETFCVTRRDGARRR